jgi:hypothetical protein
MQVDLPPPLKDEWKHITGKDVPSSVELQSFETISDHWPATTPPNPKHIHIIVVLPSGRCCLHWVNEISLTVSRLSSTSSLSDFPSSPLSLCHQLYPLSTLLPSLSLEHRAATYGSYYQTLSAPVLGKRSRASDDAVPDDLPWLSEIHLKIWNRKECRPDLFRKVEVSQADFDVLQDRLRGICPDRHSPNYDGRGNEDVLRVKLEFLRSLTQVKTPSPRHSNDNDNLVGDGNDSRSKNDDDAALKSLFPSVLSFLDLSSLELSERVSNRLPLPLFLREEYEKISNLIRQEPQTSGGSVIVSGQPGIGEFLLYCLTGSNCPYQYQGKTAYMFLRIIENMIEGRPFLFQDVAGTVYHVAENGVEMVRSWSSNNPIVAFVDGDKANFEPKEMLYRRSVQLVVASSPKGAYLKWTSQTGHASSVTRIATKLWSEKELLLTGLVLTLLFNT